VVPTPPVEQISNSISFGTIKLRNFFFDLSEYYSYKFKSVEFNKESELSKLTPVFLEIILRCSYLLYLNNFILEH